MDFKPVKIAVLFLMLLMSGITMAGEATAQGPGFREIFGDDWEKAEMFISENKTWMISACREHHVDYHLAVAVVFPELIRYSALKDKMEITLLKSLYTYYGNEYADFSVGVFQMKPSCAEAVLSVISKNKGSRLAAYFGKLHRGLSEQALRASIVREMEKPETQFQYVVALLKALDDRFENKQWKGEDERVKFYATAYNAGFTNREEYIRDQSERKTFHTGLLNTGNCYSYAEVSIAFFPGTEGQSWSKKRIREGGRR